MIRLWIEGGALYVTKSPKPRRKPGHALLRLICGGICTTDLELLRGYYSFAGQPATSSLPRLLLRMTKTGWASGSWAGSISGAGNVNGAPEDWTATAPPAR